MEHRRLPLSCVSTCAVFLLLFSTKIAHAHRVPASTKTTPSSMRCMPRGTSVSRFILLVSLQTTHLPLLAQSSRCVTRSTHTIIHMSCCANRQHRPASTQRHDRTAYPRTSTERPNSVRCSSAHESQRNTQLYHGYHVHKSTRNGRTTTWPTTTS